MTMYKCNCCGEEFDIPHMYYEPHGFTDGLYEVMYCCPFCGGDYSVVDPDEVDTEDEEVDD